MKYSSVLFAVWQMQMHMLAFIEWYRSSECNNSFLWKFQYSLRQSLRCDSACLWFKNEKQKSLQKCGMPRRIEFFVYFKIVSLTTSARIRILTHYSRSNLFDFFQKMRRTNRNGKNNMEKGKRREKYILLSFSRLFLFFCCIYKYAQHTYTSMVFAVSSVCALYIHI